MAAHAWIQCVLSASVQDVGEGADLHSSVVGGRFPGEDDRWVPSERMGRCHAACRRAGTDAVEEGRMIQTSPTLRMNGWALVFRNRSRTAVKILLYDGQGSWLCHKRLSSGKHRWQSCSVPLGTVGCLPAQPSHCCRGDPTDQGQDEDRGPHDRLIGRHGRSVDPGHNRREHHHRPTPQFDCPPVHFPILIAADRHVRAFLYFRHGSLPQVITCTPAPTLG